mmetsp:Transcript_30137/g.26701  ORF Transcript_30137/g.26701 Transcript_30137/m.26701 type:complete len:189 (+) Transcript_30137:33-599(+)
MENENEWEDISEELIEIDFAKIKAVIQNDMDDSFKHFKLKQVGESMEFKSLSNETKENSNRKILKFMLDGKEQEYEFTKTPKIGTAMYMQQLGSELKLRYKGANTSQIIVTRKHNPQNILCGSKRKAEPIEKKVNDKQPISNRIKNYYMSSIPLEEGLKEEKEIRKNKKSVKKYTRVIVTPKEEVKQE